MTVCVIITVIYFEYCMHDTFLYFIGQKFCFQFHLMSICIPGPVSWNWANIANHDKASMFKQLISALKENPRLAFFLWENHTFLGKTHTLKHI